MSVSCKRFANGQHLKDGRLIEWECPVKPLTASNYFLPESEKMFSSNHCENVVLIFRISYQSCLHPRRRRSCQNPPPLSWMPLAPDPPPPSPLLCSPSSPGHGAPAWQRVNFRLVVLDRKTTSGSFGSFTNRHRFALFKLIT